MDKIVQLFTRNWPRKLFAIFIALITWLFVNYSLVVTKTIQNIPVEVFNLPQDKTVLGLLPNGLLSQRVTLTLSGTKDVINDLEPGDLKVLINASQAPKGEWVVHITKRDLVSLNPSINLRYNITNIAHAEMLIKLSQLVTDEVPIHIMTPKGSAPEGFEMLDIWPQTLIQTLSGPEEEIEQLKKKGIEVTFDLDKITELDLEELLQAQGNELDNEVSYFIPNKWKMVPIPIRHNSIEEINDPDAKDLRIDFLKKEFLPLEKKLPVGVFYPMKYSDFINPKTYPLEINAHISSENSLTLLNTSLYIKDVSRLFLEIIRDYMQLELIAAPKNEREILRWSIQVLDMKALEDVFTTYKIANEKEESQDKYSYPMEREMQLRKRFRKFMHRLTLFTAPDKKLSVKSSLDDNKIAITSF